MYISMEFLFGGKMYIFIEKNCTFCEEEKLQIWVSKYSFTWKMKVNDLTLA